MPDQDRPRIKPSLYKAANGAYLNYDDLRAESKKNNVLWINDTNLFVPGYQVSHALSPSPDSEVL